MSHAARDPACPPAGATYRMSARHELVLVDRLPSALRAALPPLAPDEYGVVRTRVAETADATAATGTELCGAIVVSRETALLLLTLREAGPLPEYVRRQSGWEDEVARLVADGVLEIECDGAFVSGAAAAPFLWSSPRPPRARLAALSREAIRCAAALQLDDEQALAARLYAYHQEPFTPELARQLSTSAAVARYLSLDGRDDLLGRRWIAARDAATDGRSWRVWRARSRPRAHRTAHKLYVSPRSANLPAVLRSALAALADTPATAFKIGGDAYGLLRPDKFVVYFDSFDALAEAADRVESAIEGAPPHGVPFTSEIAGDGLLSWGMDPPITGPERPAGESWREWVTRRLARYLLGARATLLGEVTAQDDALVDFALERLRLDGVDTDTWIPTRSIWVERGDERL